MSNFEEENKNNKKSLLGKIGNFLSKKVEEFNAEKAIEKAYYSATEEFQIVGKTVNIFSSDKIRAFPNIQNSSLLFNQNEENIKIISNGTLLKSKNFGTIQILQIDKSNVIQKQIDSDGWYNCYLATYKPYEKVEQIQPLSITNVTNTTNTQNNNISNSNIGNFAPIASSNTEILNQLTLLENAILKGSNIFNKSKNLEYYNEFKKKIEKKENDQKFFKKFLETIKGITEAITIVGQIIKLAFPL